MKLNKLMCLYALLTGGVLGLLKYLLKVFNEQILGRLKNKETGSKYLRDAQAICTLVRAILDNHAGDLSEERIKCGEAILAAIEELVKALEDFELNETELDEIIVKVNAGITSFQKAK